MQSFSENNHILKAFGLQPVRYSKLIKSVRHGSGRRAHIRTRERTHTRTYSRAERQWERERKRERRFFLCYPFHLYCNLFEVWKLPANNRILTWNKTQNRRKQHSAWTIVLDASGRFTLLYKERAQFVIIDLPISSDKSDIMRKQQKPFSPTIRSDVAMRRINLIVISAISRLMADEWAGI